MRLLWKLRDYIKIFYRQYLIAIVALQIVALINLIPNWLIGRIVDDINANTLTVKFLALYLGAMLISAITMYLLRFVWQSKLYGASISITRILRSKLFHKFMMLSPETYSRHNTGDFMAHATNDLKAVEEATGMGIMTLVDSFIAGFTVILGMIFIINGQLATVALLPFPLLIYITYRYGHNLHKAFDQAQSAFSNLNEETRETISGIRAVRSHGIGERQKKRFDAILERTLETNLSVAKIDSAFTPTIQLLYGLSFVLSLGYGAWLIDQGLITVGLFTTFTLYLGQLLGPFLQFGWQFNVFQRGSTSWRRLEKLFAKHEEKEGINFLPINSHSDIHFNIESFSYQDSTRYALENIHLHVPSGGLVGITGPTGSGKSTLLKLVLRQFQLDESSNISISGSPINSLTLNSLRQKLAWVPQKSYLFSETIAANIALAKPNATDKEVEYVAKIAGIQDEILAMPQGFNTLLQENGTNLSGGQKQRITLARALLCDADILLLDDPFSALDMKTEAIVRQNLKTYCPNKTLLLVTQRLTNLIEADHILVLNEGRIKERGNHHELITKQGWYSTVYQRQSLLNTSLDMTEEADD